MKVKQIARLLALILTLVTMISCMAVFMVTDVYAGSYQIYDGATINSKWSGASALNKSLSGTEITLTATGNDPYFFISGVAENILQSYPFMVVRYKSDHLGTFEVHCGHPNVDSCRVSMPVVPTNGQWGVLYYDFSVLSTSKRSWFRIEPMTVSGEKLTIAEIVLFNDRADADKYGYVYANAGYRSGATGGCVVVTHNDFDYWNSANGRAGEVRTKSIAIARKNDGYFKEGGYYTRLVASGGDPYVKFSNNTTIRNAANTYTYLSVRYRASSGCKTMQVFTTENESYVTNANITGDGTWRWVTFTLKKTNGSFRLDYIGEGAADGRYVDIGEMYFHNGTQHIYNGDVGNSSDRQNNNDGRKLDVRMYFLHRDSNEYFSSAGAISAGTLKGHHRSSTGSNFKYGNTTFSAVGRTFYKVAGTHSAHQDNSGTVTANATCTAAGSKRYNCTLCNDQTRTEAIAALGHANGPAATCTTAQTCTRCSTQLAAALGHNTAGSVAHKDPTCTAAGIVGGTYCNRCNDGKAAVEAAIAALGHNAEGKVIHKDPTCTETGVVGGTYCARCNDGKTAVEAIIDALGHNTEGKVTHKDATCTETGVVGGTYCARCNDGKAAVEASIAALGHNSDGKVTHKDPTCTATGVVGGTYCARCNDGKAAVEASIAALGHAKVTDAAVAPDCTHTGLTAGEHCSRCSTVLTAQQIIDALGHNAGAAATCTTAQTCTRSCGHVFVAALGHNEKKVVVTLEPTCTVAGNKNYCCDRCSELQRKEAIAALGHNSDGKVSHKDPTCTATGVAGGTYCARCNDGKTAAEKILNALGHNAEGKVTHKDATCTETGVVGGTYCARCNDGKAAVEASIAALGHNADGKVTHKDATCTETGVVGGTYCARCNDGKSAVEAVIKALGHSITSIPKVEPTYTAVGHEAGSKCSRCSDATVQGKEIAKLNPLLSYNVALNEKFAVNMTYVAFDGATITVVDENGTAYTFTATNTGKTHTDGLPIWSIRIADISARDIGHTFTVSESLSGYSSNVSVDGYCGQVDNMYKDATVESLTAGYVASGMTEDKAQATAIKVLQAYDTTQKITIYGQAAKNYFDQDHGDHEALQTQIDSYTPTGVVQEVSNTGLVKFKGATVVFGDEVELLLKMENYHREKIFVKMGDGEYVEVPESEINSRLSTDGTYVYFSIIVKPDEFSTAISVRAGTWVMGEDGNNYYAGGSTVTYSVDKYIANMQSKYAGKTDAKSLATLNMVNALGNYGHSASTYAKS